MKFTCIIESSLDLRCNVQRMFLTFEKNCNKADQNEILVIIKFGTHMNQPIESNKSFTIEK